ncbi:hypothetical protein D3C80_2233970 [compost metagenome]
MHRYAGSDTLLAEGAVSANGTSELPMRNQFAAWKHFMTATLIAKESTHAA